MLLGTEHNAGHEFTDLVQPAQLMLFLNSGGTLDWMSEAGSDAFQCLYGGQDQQARTYQIREAQQSAELCQKAVKLCEGRDLVFVGSKINRALYENFSRIACAVLAAHKDRVDESGNNLLILSTLRGWNYVLKEMVSMEGIDVEQRNRDGETAMILACREVSCARLNMDHSFVARSARITGAYVDAFCSLAVVRPLRMLVLLPSAQCW